MIKLYYQMVLITCNDSYDIYINPPPFSMYKTYIHVSVHISANVDD